MSGAEDLAALRAARLARLRGSAPAEPAAAVLRFRRPGAPEDAPARVDASRQAPPEAPAEQIAAQALEQILEQTGAAPAGADLGEGGAAVPGAAEAPSEPACDLDRLPGAGPGLVWALRRAGFARRADLAGLAPETLALRLGALGGLIPAAAWIAAAQAAEAEAEEPAGMAPAEASAG